MATRACRFGKSRGNQNLTASIHANAFLVLLFGIHISCNLFSNDAIAWKPESDSKHSCQCLFGVTSINVKCVWKIISAQRLRQIKVVTGSLCLQLIRRLCEYRIEFFLDELGHQDELVVRNVLKTTSDLLRSMKYAEFYSAWFY
jgi:hypothetical protein